MSQWDKVIAIDGPSGSGKSTITKEVAKRLGFTYLDTGAMFRAIGFVLKNLPIDFTKRELSEDEEKQVASFLNNLHFEYGVSPDILIRVNGEDLTRTIREHEVSYLASQTSKFPVVRDFLANIQRKIAKQKKSILEGRDIGTVIFPQAALKFFLTASPKVRAERRFEQLKETSPSESFSLSEIQADIERRDHQDSQREVAPLKKANDAIEIDTSNKSIEDVINIIIQNYQQRNELFD